MNLFLKTLYMLTVMVMTGIMMVIVLLCTPEFHTKLSGGFYQQSDMSYSQFVLQSLDNPGIYLAQDSDYDDIPKNTGTKREMAWDYHGNNTGYLKILLDYTRPQHDPWPSSVECMGLKVSFARRRTLPRTALASFPGSGNTWFRYLIQSTSGLFTGSIYNDRQLASKGFYGENDALECGCTIVVKTHGYTLGVVPESRSKIVDKFYGRGVLLLRNPYDTLIAFRNYHYGGHLGIASPSAFQGADWARFVHSKVQKWGAFAKDWITGASNLHIVHFENMQVDPKQELLKIMQFLHLRVDYRRLKCVLANLNGSFRRITPENTSYRIRDPYTDELHEIVEETIRDVNKILARKGQPPLPTHLYNYHRESDNIKPDQNSIREGGGSMSTSKKEANPSTKIPKTIPPDGMRLGKPKVNPGSANSIVRDGSIDKTAAKSNAIKKNDVEKVIKLYPWMKNR